MRSKKARSVLACARSPRALLTSVLIAGLIGASTACFEVRAAGEDPPDQETPAVTESLPGALPYPEPLQKKLAEAVAAKGRAYEPRTEHLRPDGSAIFTNRLILEDSPYLQQHAHNPVNWYPWGPEAFEKAAREDKPVFLSIGYSTCHWCHVMERESFESVDIARILNEGFVSIKIDRERRPDLDEIYMTAVQLTTGRGGWPMSSFLTPEGKPFFGGTYFPPAQFSTLLGRVSQAWRDQRPQLLESADAVTAAIGEATAARGEAEAVGEEAIGKTVAQILSRHDARLGGFGGAPKFPHEPELLFLLSHALRRGDLQALAAVETSLSAMAEGGIYDQAGGGFHRYSTDARWLVPHFEKMLYNQAHLSRAYLAAYRLTGRDFYARVAGQTLDYVLREMTSPEGAFYSATDADSEGEEGLFFVWRPDELRAVLGSEDATLVKDLYGVTEGGNFEGRNILFLTRSLEEFAAEKELPLSELYARLDQALEKLRLAREKRIPPLRDDKILTAWNGMMITAFAEGSEILGRKRYLEAAVSAAEFLWRHNRAAAAGGLELRRVYLDGSSSVPAVQEDYAYLAEALIALYDAAGEEVWLARAREVADAMLGRFWDAEEGGFFMSLAADAMSPAAAATVAGAGSSAPERAASAVDKGASAPLIARPKSPTDGAIPSGNSVAVRALARLAERTGERLYSDRAGAAINAFSAGLIRHPSGFAYMMLGVDELLHGGTGPRRYAADGVVRAEAALAAASGGGLEVTVALRIREGWHVNAHRPLQPELIPTELALSAPRAEPEAPDSAGGASRWSLADLRYPEPRRVRLAFQKEKLAVYEGRVRIAGRLAPGDGKPAPAGEIVSLVLKVQACNDEVCLRPEDLLLRIPVALADS